MTIPLDLSPPPAPTRSTMADAVYQDLRRAILELRLKPGMRVSEAEIARQMGVSRQPVREAFIRLARIGYLNVQPQRRTEIVKISVREVLNARFIREALEVAVVRRACEGDTRALVEQLTANLTAQRAAQEADDRREFHRLDDMFHRLIAEGAGCGFTWALIDEQKAQLDRMRFLTLSYGQPDVYDDHLAIFEALKARDPAKAEAAMRVHLGRIIRHLERLRMEFGEYFEETGETLVEG
ncbi:GntR family transcriptional regulator [Jiella endophytica]|nr:GntR family transcriptional regulator [Jiella endophytica]